MVIVLIQWIKAHFLILEFAKASISVSSIIPPNYPRLKFFKGSVLNFVIYEKQNRVEMYEYTLATGWEVVRKVKINWFFPPKLRPLVGVTWKPGKHRRFSIENNRRSRVHNSNGSTCCFWLHNFKGKRNFSEFSLKTFYNWVLLESWCCICRFDNENY